MHLVSIGNMVSQSDWGTLQFVAACFDQDNPCPVWNGLCAERMQTVA